jgi:hypothetical protein
MQLSDLMPRSRINFRLDDRILGELEELAGKGKMNQFVEGLLFEFLKSTGRLPKDAEPLPEARGGKRQGAGKPKKSTNDCDIPTVEES